MDKITDEHSSLRIKLKQELSVCQNSASQVMTDEDRKTKTKNIVDIMSTALQGLWLTEIESKWIYECLTSNLGCSVYLNYNKLYMRWRYSCNEWIYWCTQGENRFIESICQTIFSLEELLDILNDASVCNNLKQPYLRFLLWVYLNTASGMVDSGAGDLPHSGCVLKAVSFS